jgi:hypothetical protein
MYSEEATNGHAVASEKQIEIRVGGWSKIQTISMRGPNG